MSGLTIRRLTPPASGYGDWTFPYFAPLLDAAAPAVTAVGLENGTGPAGLCLARTSAEDGVAELLSLYLAADHRGQGWGTRLLAETEAVLQARGVREVRVVYLSGEHTPALEAVLRKRGWAKPALRMILCKTDAARFMQAPWLRSARLAPGFEIFSWRDLPPELRPWIRAREGTPGWHPAVLSPFKDEAYYDPETSVGLRHAGELAGWVITHRVIPGSLRYTNVFVREDLRWRAPHLPMIAEVTRRHVTCRHYADTPYGMFNQPVGDAAVHRFFTRRLEPYLISVKESKGSWKRLE